MFNISLLAQIRAWRHLHRSSIASLMTLCLPIVNKSDVLIMVGFRVWSDLCCNL